MHKRYTLPPNCSASEIVVRELTVGDELEIAAAIEARGNDDSPEVRMHESIRQALAEVDGQPVNVGGVRYPLERWSARTLRFATRAFLDLNGVDESEMESFRAAGSVVDASEIAAKRAAVSPADIARQYAKSASGSPGQPG